MFHKVEVHHRAIVKKGCQTMFSGPETVNKSIYYDLLSFNDDLIDF